VAVAAAAFGVIGATVGAFFSVKSATDALARVQRDRRARAARSDVENDGGETAGPSVEDASV
jgi:hypothetical protein